jgi:sialate O-acetylesterase
MSLKPWALLAFLLIAQAHVDAEVKPSSIFGDHMVLQRDMPVPVWGTAKPGEQLTVHFADHQVTTKADANGKWMVELPALKASATGRQMSISGAEDTAVIRDVLVGEVWVCSGQSNMQYGWGKKSHPRFNWGGDADLAALAEKARGKPIRSFDVHSNVAWEPIDTVNGAWSRGPSGSAVAFGFSYYLHEALDVPVAVIVTCWGSSSIEGWMPLDMTEQLPHFKEMMERLHASEQAKARIDAAIKRGVRHGNVFIRKQPNLLYNAMLHPIIPYACRGFVWYQGEANANRPAEYDQSLPLWIKRLRTEWGRDDLFFLTVMLPGYGQDDGTPTARSWAWFRDVQLHSLRLPHTGVANTIDLGDAKKIHPPDKAPICQRLSLLARSDVYGQRVGSRGPMLDSFTPRGNRMRVAFDHAEGLKTTDGKPPAGFWLAGSDRKWHPATATIDGNTVVLTAEGVDAPVACRYAFSGKPKVNLINKDNLPAYPFRTDDWTR